MRPILILDDVSADIDEGRRERLFDYVAKDLQAFVSTTEEASLGLQPDRYARFEVRQGRLSGP
jgi:recombinational DNA repair ATPase RecF